MKTQDPLCAAGEDNYSNLLIPSAAAKTFQEHLAKTQVSDAALAALESSKDTRPFIMLNCVRFRPYRDPALYMKYGAVAATGVDVQGSYTPYFASAVHDLDPSFGFDDSWDEITVPVYSRFASYGLVQENSDYQAALPDRVAGTFQRQLYALQDGKPFFPGTISIQELHQDGKGFPHSKTDVLVCEFLRFKKPDGRQVYAAYAKAVAPLIKKAGGQVFMSVEATIPVVSEELWDHFTLARYPSLEAYETMFKSDDFVEAGTLRRKALAAKMSYPTSQAVELNPNKPKPTSKTSFDHVHLVSKDPAAAAKWYQDKLNGEIISHGEVDGALQLNVDFDGAHVTIRGARKGENPKPKAGFEWGVIHFGLRIPGDYDAFCDHLKVQGVKFTMGPKDFHGMGKVAYIEDGDGYRVEIVQYAK